MLGALLAISLPSFVIGPLLILIFAIYARLLPVGGWGTLARFLHHVMAVQGRCGFVGSGKEFKRKAG
jgi:ABC-type dipeptide/oligopeptide/nickel transport system permease component